VNQLAFLASAFLFGILFQTHTGFLTSKFAPAIIHDCSSNQKQNAAVNKLALIMDGDMLGYAPKPRRKP